MQLDRLPALVEGGFRVVIESPRGSPLKLKWDPELSAIVAQRALPLGFTYPYDWGFVPSTRAPDGDPVDALVYWEVPSYPGVVVACRALGVLGLEQDSKKGGRERNDRLLVVPLEYPRASQTRSVHDLPARVRDEIAHFFTSAVYFEPKHPKILGWDGPDSAQRLIRGESSG